MQYTYVVEKIERSVVTHIGAKDLKEAEQISSSIPRSCRGGVYVLYTKEILPDIKQDGILSTDNL